MTTKDRNIAILNWLSQCGEIADIFCLVGKAKNDNTVFVPNVSEEWTKEFNDGTGEKELTFTLITYKDITTEPNTNDNAKAQFDVEKVMEWVREQNANSNYPQFADNETIFEIEVLENMPTMAGADEKTAKFMFAVKINYYKGD